MNHNFANNLRCLRQKKHYTQEQVAEKLGVSIQSVSRWECGTTYPDIMLLPELARLYDVLVDDLYRDKQAAYDNYAQRLFAVYESSREPEDYILAYREFQKLIRSNQETAEDLRLFGILHQYMMNFCKKKALSVFDTAENRCQAEERELQLAIKQQRQSLLASIGEGKACVEKQRTKVENGSTDVQDWILLLGALSWMKQFNDAYQWFLKAKELFPDEKLIYVFGGDACGELGKNDEAFQYWDKALSLDSRLYDVRFSKGFFYEKLGDYQKALDMWQEIVDMLRKDGFEAELEYPMRLAKQCEEKLNR